MFVMGENFLFEWRCKSRQEKLNERIHRFDLLPMLFKTPPPEKMEGLMRINNRLFSNRRQVPSQIVRHPLYSPLHPVVKW